MYNCPETKLLLHAGVDFVRTSKCCASEFNCWFNWRNLCSCSQRLELRNVLKWFVIQFFYIDACSVSLLLDDMFGILWLHITHIFLDTKRDPSTHSRLTFQSSKIYWMQPRNCARSDYVLFTMHEVSNRACVLAYSLSDHKIARYSNSFGPPSAPVLQIHVTQGPKDFENRIAAPEEIRD